MKKKNLLPDQPSALLSLALRDLEKAEKSKKYEVYMGDWHLPSGQYTDGTPRPCAVCMAGAIMALSLKSPDDQYRFPHDYDPDTHGKLTAVNAFRMGEVCYALASMGVLGPTAHPQDRRITDYNIDSKKFKKEIKCLISELKAVNL